MNSAHAYRDLILNTSEPLVIKDVLNWNLLKWDINTWSTILKGKELPFRHGKNDFTKDPQFENTTSIDTMSFKKFLAHQTTLPQEWLYFDYKYLKEWLTDIEDINRIDWKEFGFPELNFEHSTIWIGSKGAHTPCHIDTYGCNMVAQVYGRKRWILFPPDENLQPTRVPYEESSIYSKINFFTPNEENFKEIGHCRSIILNPGEVLILPHRWWHYVENIDVAISINTWLELPIDDEERVGEAIVRMLMWEMVKNLKPEQQQLFLNPGSLDDQIIGEAALNSFSIISACLKNCKHEKNKMDDKNASHKWNIEETLEQFKNVTTLKELTREEFKELLSMQGKRCSYGSRQIGELEKEDNCIKHVIDAVLDVDVINLIKQNLLKK